MGLDSGYDSTETDSPESQNDLSEFDESRDLLAEHGIGPSGVLPELHHSDVEQFFMELALEPTHNEFAMDIDIGFLISSSITLT